MKMFTLKKAAGTSICLLATALVAGCSSTASEAGSGAASTGAASTAESSASVQAQSGATLGFSHPASQVPLVVALQDQVVAVGDERGDSVLTDNTLLKLDAQVASVQSWVTQKVDAINVLPLDPAAFAPLQKQAQEEGICWTTYAVPMEGADGLVALSAEQSGQIVADATTQWIAENSPNAEVLMLTNSADRNFAPRTEVPKAALEKTGAKIVAEQDAVDLASGLTVTETALKANPNIRVVVAFNDDGALGAAKAFENAGIPADEVFIIGQDGSKEGLEALTEPGSYYKASVAIPLRDLATAVVDVMDNCLAGKEPLTVPVDSVLVTSNDVDAVQQLLLAYA